MAGMPTTVRFIDKGGGIAGTVLLGEELAPFIETLRQTAIAYGFAIDLDAPWDPECTTTLSSESEADAYLRALRDPPGT